MDNKYTNNTSNDNSSDVEKLSKREKENFSGITLEDASNKNYEHRQYYEESTFRTRHRPKKTIKIFSLNSNKLPLWQKFLFLLGGISLFAFFVFFVFPFIFGVGGVLILAYLLYKFLKK